VKAQREVVDVALAHGARDAVRVVIDDHDADADLGWNVVDVAAEGDEQALESLVAPKCAHRHDDASLLELRGSRRPIR
jgi:hypothetical protein